MERKSKLIAKKANYLSNGGHIKKLANFRTEAFESNLRNFRVEDHLGHRKDETFPKQANLRELLVECRDDLLAPETNLI